MRQQRIIWRENWKRNGMDRRGKSGTLEAFQFLCNMIDFKPLGRELAKQYYSAAWLRNHMGCLSYNSINRRED